MIDIEAVMADFAVRQAERQTQVVEEIQQLKKAILPRLQDAGIARVEIRFDGCGDNGAVENVSVWMQLARRCLARMSPCWKAKLTKLIVPVPQSCTHSGRLSSSLPIWRSNVTILAGRSTTVPAANS